MTDKAATGKKLAITIWDEPEIPLAEEGATLHCVRMEETENNYVEYYGELWKNLMTAAESCLTATTR